MDYEKILKSIQWEKCISSLSSVSLSDEAFSYLLREYFVNNYDDRSNNFFYLFCRDYVISRAGDLCFERFDFLDPIHSEKDKIFLSAIREISNGQCSVSDSARNVMLLNSYRIFEGFGFDSEDLKSERIKYTHDDAYVLLSKEEIEDMFSGIKRSDGYMEKRWNCIRSLLIFGHLDENSFSLVTNNLSKQYRVAANELCTSRMRKIKSILCIKDIASYRFKDTSKFRFTKEEFESLLFSYRMIAFHTLKDLDFWEQKSYFYHSMTLDDVPYVLPLADTFKAKDHLFQAIDGLRRAEQRKK